MKRCSILIAILILFSINFLAEAETDYVPGQLLIQLFPEDTENVKILTKDFSNIGLRPKKQISKRMHIWLFEFAPNRMPDEKILHSVRTHKSVRIAQFNHYVEHRSTYPNDPNFDDQWALENIGQTGGATDADIDAPEAWDITTGGVTALGDTVVVAIIDGGTDLNHNDLIQNFWKNKNEIPNNGIDDDNNGYVDDYHGWNAYGSNGNVPTDNHGTHVCGISAAKGNNGLGVTGVNWDAKILPIAGSSGVESIVVEAYTYALDMRALYNETNGQEGAFIVCTNASFGVDYANPDNYPLWSAIYDSLGNQGVLSAGATANNNVNVDVVGDMPTACDSDFLITVTNTTHQDQKAYSAGYGLTTIDLGAPGTNVKSTIPGNAYSNKTGTSMATPHVTGAVALLFAGAPVSLLNQYEQNPAQVALQIKQYILDGADPLASLQGKTVTGGRLNLYNSLQIMLEDCSGVSGHISEDTVWWEDTLRVSGDVFVDDGVTLTINSGVKVEFQGHYKLDIQGKLLAIGTESDSIIFTINDTTGFADSSSILGSWSGIEFNGTPENNGFSHLMHCKLEYAKAIGDSLAGKGGGILVTNFNRLLIYNCNISNNYAQIDGGGIYCYNSDITLKNSIISHNRVGTDSTGHGGGIYAEDSDLIVKNCEILGNNSTRAGGGMGFYESSPTIWNNKILNNATIEFSGGGILFWNSDPEVVNNQIMGNYAVNGGGLSFFEDSTMTRAITNNLIANNSSESFGGGVFCKESSPNLNNNTIVNNQTTYGGGLFCFYADPIVNNNIIWGNSAIVGSQVYLWDMFSSPEFYFCDIQDGLDAFGGAGSGNNWSGIYQNCIELDPIFMVAGEHPFALQEDSPCRDTGTPDISNLNLPPFDLANDPRVDNDIVDIGAYEYQSEIPVDVKEEAISQLPTKIKLHSNYPNPFNPETTISFQIPQTSKVYLNIYDISGKLVNTLIDGEKEAGYHSVVWDGKDEIGREMSSGVYFYKLNAAARGHAPLFTETKKMLLLK